MAAKYLQVLVAIPDDVPVADAREYVRSELRTAGGCRRSDDPLFHGLTVVAMTSIRVPK